MSSLLRKIFSSRVKYEEPSGATLDRSLYWTAKGDNIDSTVFFRTLEEIFPDGSILQLEGTPSPDVKEYLCARLTDDTLKISKGTIWPHPECFRISIMKENMNGLAELSKSHAEPEFCDHLVIYRDNEVLMEWHDAFLHKSEMDISGSLPAETVKEFCDALNTSYKQNKGHR